jgi:NAD(P)H-dependent FMN reductase
MKLGIIIGTTRENRQTVKQAAWVAKTAQAVDGITVDVLDLSDAILR